GSILRGVFRDAKESIPGGITRLMEGVPSGIRGAHFSSNIIHGMWYPYEAFAALLDALSRAPAHGRPEAFRQLGERMAERDLTTLLRVYAMITSPTRLAEVPRKIWEQRFRGAGVAASEVGEMSFRFTISGFPGIHPLHCELLTGYGLATGRRSTRTFDNVHDRCVHRGDRECSFLSRW
ncbi:MAG TPA: hypothetical protein VLA75_06680, partial [Thermoanaerobaculia bacterium]|nr:hypothetical protein [Thermoanaerobaculia bacterium]